MKAIYKNRIYNVVDSAADLTLEGQSIKPFHVSFADPQLIVDPTDDEVAESENLAEWYGLDEEKARQLRRMLCGEMSLEEWYKFKDGRS